MADSAKVAVAVLGPVEVDDAVAQLREMFSSLASLMLIVLALVAVVLLFFVLATVLVRIALVVLLVVAAPLALACHALPQTEGAAQTARRGWRCRRTTATGRWSRGSPAGGRSARRVPGLPVRRRRGSAPAAAPHWGS